MSRIPALTSIVGAAFSIWCGCAARAASLADFYDLTKPTGNGPFPAVVLAPGCGGFHDQYSPPVFDSYRSRLTADGFVVSNVDFTRAHDIASCSTSTALLITQDAYATDIIAALADLKKQRFVDPTRIHIWGWSYGGGAAFDALALAEKRPDIKIASVVAYFPWCGPPRPWAQPVPVLVLRGAADAIAPFSKCEAAAATALANKSMHVVVYPGATHSFDQFTLPKSVDDKNAATAAWREAEAFLKR